jgi:hypothetical protein
MLNYLEDANGCMWSGWLRHGQLIGIYLWSTK